MFYTRAESENENILMSVYCICHYLLKRVIHFVKLYLILIFFNLIALCGLSGLKITIA